MGAAAVRLVAGDSADTLLLDHLSKRSQADTFHGALAPRSEPGELVGRDVLRGAGGLAGDELELVAGPDSDHAGKAARSNDNHWPPGRLHYPIRKVTTPVAVEGGVAGGGLPRSAGTSFQGRRKPNGSAFHRRIMAGVQDAAKHAMSAMSPLKSCDVEKPQPNRKMLQAVLVAVFAAAVLEARRRPSTYSSRRPGRQVTTSVDQVVSFTIATDDRRVMVTVPPPLAW